MKNNKNVDRTPRDRDEKRRLLLNKKYELSYSLDNDKLPFEGVATLTKKRIYQVLALVVALAVLVPSIFGIYRVFADDQLRASGQGTKQVEEVVTRKTAEPNGDGTYHVKIEAFNKAYSLYNPPTDSVLVLERSSKMADVLYSRDKTNLLTNTIFSGTSMDSNNALFDVDNPSNVYLKIFGQEIKFAVNNTYRDNKYVKDPNNPDVYVYLCQTYVTTHDGLLNYNNHYTYSIVDTQGNIYESDTINQNLAASSLDALLGSLASSLSSLTLKWKGNTNYPSINTYEDYVAATGLTSTKKEYTVDYIYTRDDDNATNARLWDQYKNHGGLWIKDDYGELCSVSITRYGRNGQALADSASDDDAAYYVYTTTDSQGKEFTATYGNPVYGGQYSVFQGFKTYDSTGTVDHKNSIEHKTLYNGEPQDVTYLLAMQEASEDFILQVHKNAYDNGLVNDEQKIGVISYASRSENLLHQNRLTKTEYPLTDVYSEPNAYKMIKTIYAMEADGRRRIDLGLEYAKDMLDNRKTAKNNNLDTTVNPGSAADHKVNVIAFTTGMPSTDINGSFETSVANNAISQARAIEAAYPLANVYTIGMYDLADTDELHGDWFYRSGLFGHNNIPCDGSVGSYWGGTTFSGISNDGMDPRDAAATNRFLNYLSSNFRTATQVGLDGPKRIRPAFWSTGGTGYEITQNFDRTDEGYYYAAHDADDVLAAFDDIAIAIQVPLSELNDETELVDHISDYFNITGNVSAYTMSYDGNGDPEDENTVWTQGTSLTPATSNGGKTVTVTGFDYSTNYCAPGHPGEKVVMEFDVEPIDHFLGGHDVPTNLGSSAVIDKNGTVVENLPYPEVDVDLVNDLEVHNDYIYYSKETDLEKLFDVSPYAQGLTNDFVNVTYELYDADAEEGADPVMTYFVAAGDDTGSSSLQGEDKGSQYPALENNKTYHVKCTVSTVDEDVNDREELTDTKDATVYVYKPTVTLQDTTKDYADAVAGINLNENRVSVTWSAVDTDHAAPEGTPPTLEYEFYDLTNTPKTLVDDPTDHSMSTTTNYNVDVIVKGHAFTYETLLPYYVKTDDSTVLVSEYAGDKSDLKPVTYIVVDEDGNETTVTETDENGDTVYQIVYQTTTVHDDKADAKDSAKHFTTYINQTDDAKTNDNTEGNFTVYTGNAYDLYITKIFDGDYVVPEGVRFVLTGSDSSTQNIEIAADQFTRLSSGEKKLTDELRTGVTYTLEEQFLEETDIVYNTTATQQNGTTGQPAALADTDATDGKTIFQFTVAASEDPGRVTIVVTNEDTSEPPVITGVNEKESTPPTALLIALASTVVLGTGGYGVYRIYRPGKENG